MGDSASCAAYGRLPNPGPVRLRRWTQCHTYGTDSKCAGTINYPDGYRNTNCHRYAKCKWHPNETPSTDCTYTYTPTNTATYTPTPTATPTPYRNGYYEWKKAVQFAREHKNLEYFKNDVGDGENPRPYAENNCANFTSYALYAGGLNITDEWKPDAEFKEETGEYGFNSKKWVNANGLLQYLKTTANFRESEIFWTKVANCSYPLGEVSACSGSLLPLRSHIVETSEWQGGFLEENKGTNFNYYWPEYLNLISNTKPGDLIFYKSNPISGNIDGNLSDYMSGNWSHVGIITEGWQTATEFLFSYDSYKEYTSYVAPNEPRLIDHSGPTDRLPRSIGDTEGSIGAIMILHQP